jgi:tRNA A-37 threonylcarbamoyl transferase component Bud32
MGFEIGETVGPYKIIQYLGQGGMATIYRAQQVTLDRDVALKVIHPALKDDESFLLRFKREASIVAKLNHPNIVPVYDFGEFEGVSYIVMQYIEGQTLKDILADKKLGTKQILDIVRPVADALSYAHSRGVLHRDVKPSNILIDSEGNVYLVDFGLARIAQSNDSTLSHDMIIGSPQYISPEQGKGEEADDRSDLYSFAVVVYEMFTSHIPFAGDTPYSTILSHINDPLPPPRQFNAKINPAVEQVLVKALAKDRAQRFRSIREFMRALENAVRGPSEDNEPVAPILIAESRPISSNPIGDLAYRVRAGLETRDPPIFIIAAIALACLLLLYLLGFGYLAMQNSTLAAMIGGRSTAPTRALPVIITTPTYSGFSTTPGALLTQAAGAGNPIAVSTPTPARPSSPRGKIAYTIATGDSAEQHSVWVASADGTNAHLVAESSMWPALSPDSTQIAYYRMKSENGIWAQNLDGGKTRLVIPGADLCCVSWAPDAKRIAYFKGNLKIGGTIYISNSDGTGVTEVGPGFNPSWAPTGGRLAYAGCMQNTSQCGIFVYTIASGSSRLITRDNGGSPQWSPLGDRIAYQADDGKSHINVFTINSDGTGGKQLTFGRSNDGQPDWSRDGNFIFWRSDQNGTAWAIYVMHSDGSNPRVLIRNAPPDGDLWGYESLSGGP